MTLKQTIENLKYIADKRGDEMNVLNQFTKVMRVVIGYDKLCENLKGEKFWVYTAPEQWSPIIPEGELSYEVRKWRG